MERLIKIGFEKVGSWKLNNDKLELKIDRHHKEKDLLYAFVCKNSIKYIGKSIRTLESRMLNYRNPDITQKTNVKNNANIKSLLNNINELDIYIFFQKEKMIFKGFEINLAAGLEDSLIKEIKPEWNNAGKDKKIK